MMEAVAEVQINKYPAYKKSGVDWLGDVPVHWEITRLKWIFSEKVKRTDINLPCGSISYGQVVYKIGETSTETIQAGDKLNTTAKSSGMLMISIYETVYNQNNKVAYTVKITIGK
jgi:hypothetical protein